MSYRNNVIASNDPQAVEKLTEKINKCVELQETMKEVNAYYRKNGTCVGSLYLTEEQSKRIDNRINAASNSWDNIPFSDYVLKNNYAEIRRLEKRIAEITRNQEVGFSGWEFTGGRAEANTELSRLQLYFDDIPDENKRYCLKTNGFKWAPSQNAWQRLLNDNAIHAASRIEFIKPLDGRTVREHQPKVLSNKGITR